jgi:hypothetical protein
MVGSEQTILGVSISEYKLEDYYRDLISVNRIKMKNRIPVLDALWYILSIFRKINEQI